MSAVTFTSNVLPSGFELATASAAIAPLAPALFSTTTETPSLALKISAAIRPAMSDGPPAAKPTTKRIGSLFTGCAAEVVDHDNKDNKENRNAVNLNMQSPYCGDLCKEVNAKICVCATLN